MPIYRAKAPKVVKFTGAMLKSTSQLFEEGSLVEWNREGSHQNFGLYQGDIGIVIANDNNDGTFKIHWPFAEQTRVWVWTAYDTIDWYINKRSLIVVTK